MAKTAKIPSKRGPKAKTMRGVKSVAHHFLGEEPTFASEPSLTQLVRALTWFTRTHKIKEAREYVFEYMRAHAYPQAQIDKVFAARGAILMTDCAVARLITQGNAMPDKSHLYVRDRLKTLMAANDVEDLQVDDDGNIILEEEPKQTKKVSPRIHAERRATRVNEALIEHIDGSVDNIARGIAPTYSSAFELFQGIEPGPISLQFIAHWVTDQMLWVGDASLNPKDYAWTRTQLRQVQSLYEDIRDEAHKRLNTKRERKPRKVRTKNVQKMVEKVRFMAESTTAKAKSVPPENILGSQEVWVWNETFKTVGVYYAADAKGLELSRSSIKGFDEERSIEKRVGRKPAEVCERVVTSGKPWLKKIMGELKAEAKVLSGRLTPNTLILRCVK